MSEDNDVVVEALKLLNHQVGCNWWNECKDSTPCTCIIGKALPIARQRARLWPLYEELTEWAKDIIPLTTKARQDWFNTRKKILKAIDEAKRQEEKYRD